MLKIQKKIHPKFLSYQMSETEFEPKSPDSIVHTLISQ